MCKCVRPPANNIGGVILYRASQFTPWLFRKIWLFCTTPGVFPYFMCSWPFLASMIYWFLLILGCQACTKSLITYVANIDSSYVGFFIILRSYVCRILDLYQVLMYVCRIYWFLMSAIFLSVLNSYVCRMRQSIPNRNTLFKKGCAYQLNMCV